MKLTAEQLSTVIEVRPGVPGKMPSISEETNADGTVSMEDLTLKRALVEAALASKDTEKQTQAQLLDKYDFVRKINSANGVGLLELTPAEKVRLLDGTVIAFKAPQGDYIFGEVHALLSGGNEE